MSKKVTIQYQQDPGYKLLPVQGAWVGLTPTGDLVADLYVERPTTPEEVVIEVDPPEIKEIERRGERQIRQVLMGLVLRPDVAFALGGWLQQKARSAGYNPPEDPDRH